MAGVVLAIASSALLACGGDEDDAAGPTGGTTLPATGGGGGAGGSGGAAGGQAGQAGEAPLGPIPLCTDPPPSGATLAPDPPAYSEGTCPVLVDGDNAITSQGAARSFLLAIPKDLTQEERLPVIFFWHWLGGDAQDFYDKANLRKAVDEQRFVAVVPSSIGAYVFGIQSLDVKWPFDPTQSADRMNEEFVFFDDMLACVSEQLPVEKNCVASAGVSAGALFTDQLAGGRGEYLSSVLSMSGGVGGLVIKAFGNPENRMPFVVLWGGDGDDGPRDELSFGSVGIDFAKASDELETKLVERNHFLVECVHNCGHTEPPVEAVGEATAFASLWDFVLHHPYWLEPGQSPYLARGLPANYPSWCAIGKDAAIPRTGPGCPPPPAP